MGSEVNRKIKDLSNFKKDQLSNRNDSLLQAKKNTSNLAVKIITSKNLSVKKSNIINVRSLKEKAPKNIVESTFEPKTLKKNKQDTILSRKLATPKINTESKFTNVTIPATSISKKYTRNNISAENKEKWSLGFKMCKMLNLPKAKNWIYYEWFYSNIDKPLLYKSEFTNYVRICFPKLTIKQMTRNEWGFVRKMLGKPRRFSEAFLREEIETLKLTRNKIRFLQQRKALDYHTFADLPDDIPEQISVGSKVTAMLWGNSVHGLFYGTIKDYDSQNHTYSVFFDEHNLGTRSIPDYEVCSDEPPIFCSKTSIIQEMFPNYSVPLEETAIKDFKTNQSTSVASDHSKAFFVLSVKLKNMLNTKKEYLNTLMNMNIEAKEILSLNKEISLEFMSSYEQLASDLHNLNTDLRSVMHETDEQLKLVSPEETETWPSIVNHVQVQSHEEARHMVEGSKEVINSCFETLDEHTLTLIKNFLAFMIQFKKLTKKKLSDYELNVLKGALNEIKCILSKRNKKHFEKYVEIPFIAFLNNISSNVPDSMPPPNE